MEGTGRKSYTSLSFDRQSSGERVGGGVNHTHLLALIGKVAETGLEVEQIIYVS